MRQAKRCILLSMACVLVVFCAVRAVRKPAASEGGQKIEACENQTQAGEKETDIRLPNTAERTNALVVETTDDGQQRYLETAQEAQRLKQQEAAQELQQRQQEATRPLS